MNVDRNSDFQRLFDIISHLRSPNGCPWDREQTLLSMRSAIIEEAYELVDAIVNSESEEIKEELGDLFLVATMVTLISQQEGLFQAGEVFDKVCEKLLRRHPHVFQKEEKREKLSADQVLEVWHATKKAEKREYADLKKRLNLLPGEFPPLLKADKVQKIAAREGFDWNSWQDVIPKVEEEIGELIESAESGSPSEIEGEVGDLLFTVVNLARKLSIDPQLALLRSTDKFIKRFSSVEEKMKEDGVTMCKENLDKMEQYWEESK